MALVPCGECGKEVSDQAPTCPHCGVKTPSHKRHRMRMYITIAVIAVVAILCAFTFVRLRRTFAGATESPAPSQSATAPYKYQTPKSAAPPKIVYTYKDTVRRLLEQGEKPRKISKETGIRLDEVKRIKKEMDAKTDDRQ